MHAIIFDIDGTLIESSEVDGRLYDAAIQSVIGPSRFRDNWGAYKHVTDGGILEEVLLDNGIAHSESITGKVKAAFFKSLSDHIDSHGPFPEIPGARHFVESLSKAEEVAVAYATGGWDKSARMKPQSAGFPLTAPLATADDSNQRVEIMRLALDSLSADFEKVTYYGDGEWDRVAAHALGWAFVPVGEKLGGIKEYISSAGERGH